MKVFHTSLKKRRKRKKRCKMFLFKNFFCINHRMYSLECMLSNDDKGVAKEIERMSLMDKVCRII